VWCFERDIPFQCSISHKAKLSSTTGRAIKSPGPSARGFLQRVGLCLEPDPDATTPVTASSSWFSPPVLLRVDHIIVFVDVKSHIRRVCMFLFDTPDEISDRTFRLDSLLDMVLFRNNRYA
jgi:hypothetical protein